MRVVHIIKVTRISGAERHLLVLLTGLRKQGVDAQLIILTEPHQPMDDMMQIATENDIPIHRIIIKRDYDLRVIFHIREYLRYIQPDMVHTHLIHADLYGLIASKLARIKRVIASRHNDDPFRYHSIVRKVSRVLWWLSDGGIAIASSIRDFVVTVEGANYDKIDVIHYGIDYAWTPDEMIQQARASIRQELQLDDETVLLGMVCRLVEQKGIPYTLEAFRCIYDYFPDTHLIMAGDGELAGELKQQAKTLGISERVHWLGWREDAPTIIASLDIFLMPSLWEGFGLVLLETMSARVPIIASRVSAIPEVIVDGESGWLVKARDVDGLSQALYHLLMDRPFRKHMGLLGEDHLQQTFSADLMVEKTIAVYNRVLV